MPFTSETAREASSQVAPEIRRRAAAHRWTPDARVRAAVKQLVDNAPALSPEQIERLRALLPEPTVAKTGRGRAA